MNRELEVHIKSKHKEKECHECDDCGKVFVLKWRLKKHMSLHLSVDVQPCHYFTNNKTCPFEDLGCMFAHKVSGFCKFREHCKNELCSFQHRQVHGSETKYQCQECEEKLTTHDNLIQGGVIYHRSQNQAVPTRLGVPNTYINIF
jgi:hypothetical protein